MALFIFPAFDRHASIKSATTGECLARNFEALDEVAERLCLTPITAFADRREVPEDFEGDPDELKDVLGPCTEWFDSSEGAEAISALADAISDDREAFGMIDCLEELQAELYDLTNLLTRAAKQGLRFRLEIS